MSRTKQATYRRALAFGTDGWWPEPVFVLTSFAMESKTRSIQTGAESSGLADGKAKGTLHSHPLARCLWLCTSTTCVESIALMPAVWSNVQTSHALLRLTFIR